MNGYIVIDTDAEKGNFIFLPAAGTGLGGNISGVGSVGIYWSSTEYTGGDWDWVWYLAFTDTHFDMNVNFKIDEDTVRPIQN